MKICHAVLEPSHAMKYGKTTGTFLKLLSANAANRWLC